MNPHNNSPHNHYEPVHLSLTNLDVVMPMSCFIIREFIMAIPAKKYSEVIAKKVVAGVKNGVAVRDILGSVQKYQDAPASTATFYKLYGNLIAETKADIVGVIGSVVVEAAKGGDFKAAEFFLRSKGGWSPNSTVNEVEQDVDPDLDESAIDSLMSLLGKSDPDEETDNG